ncbi:MAG: DnaJ domain-containing protein [Paludibacteraceae bacterium]|nr:DnaJ domain-containing protein [Paludibacteraceae bacterium]
MVALIEAVLKTLLLLLAIAIVLFFIEKANAYYQTFGFSLPLPKKKTGTGKEAIAQLLFIVMKADGAVSKEEVVKAYSYLKATYPSAEAEARYKMLVNQIVSDRYNVDFYTVKNECRLTQTSSNLVCNIAYKAREGLSPDERYALVEFLLAVACVGGISPKEWTVVCKIMSCFYLRENELEYFRNCYRSSFKDDAGTENGKMSEQRNHTGTDTSNNGADSSLYFVLGLPYGASQEQVRLAYRDLAKKYHPDMVQDELLKTVYAEKIKTINEAYNRLRK